VTVAGSARRDAAERTHWGEAVGRAGVFACAGVLATANALADRIIGPSDSPMILRILDLGGISAVIWFAMFAALIIGFQADREPLRKSDWPILLIVLACTLVPVTWVARAALVLCAAYLFVTSRPREPTRRAALVLLALTGTLVWGPLIMSLFAGPVLSLDAHIAGWVIGSPVNANMVKFVASDRIYIIAMGCSSIHNMSLAIVLWCTAVALFDLKVDWRLLLVGAAMMGVTFVLNVARLSAIGRFPDYFDFLHMGAGAVLFGWAALIGMALLAGLGVNNALARQR